MLAARAWKHQSINTDRSMVNPQPGLLDSSHNIDASGYVEER